MQDAEEATAEVPQTHEQPVVITKHDGHFTIHLANTLHGLSGGLVINIVPH